MVCSKCKSASLSIIPADIRLYRDASRTMNHPPMSPQPNVQICLDCGNAEFVAPERWLAAGWLQAHKTKPLANVPRMITEVRRFA